MPNDTLPGPCRLCGSTHGTLPAGEWICAECEWRYGDVPDSELPLPRIDVVYYVRFDQRVKIGTSMRPRQRLAAIRHEELLAFERGDRTVERGRHAQFAALREGGEWFTFAGELKLHVTELQSRGEPWRLYGRWLSHALQG